PLLPLFFSLPSSLFLFLLSFFFSSLSFLPLLSPLFLSPFLSPSSPFLPSPLSFLPSSPSFPLPLFLFSSPFFSFSPSSP
ncbi:hypothetical protein, partial [Staphylococcus aureus]|uniref:hypothetical protein n=1 Tax=Staphylococcus aureus TaxID=1280 RepID=UPI0015BDB26D